MRFFSKITVILLLLVTACATGINRQQEKAYIEYKDKGLLVEDKNPETAFNLGFFPGGASFYNGDYDVALFSLISWPISVIWETTGAKKRSMLINFKETERLVKNKFKKEVKNLDEELELEEINQKEYQQRFSEIHNKYYNKYSFLLERYKTMAIAGASSADSSGYFNEGSNNSFLSKVDNKITSTCNKEYEIFKKEFNSLSRNSFVHKCKIDKRKQFVDLGL